MRILITGATGNLGLRLVPKLYQLEEICGILVRATSTINPEISSLEKLSILRPSSENDIVGLIKVFKPDVIIHAACDYGNTGLGDDDIFHTNINLGLAIIEALDFQNSVKTFININTALPAEISAYAKSKHQFSSFCKDFSKKSRNRFRYIDLITQNIYGGGSVRSEFISMVIDRCLKEDGELKLTLGSQKRDFIHIDDVVSAIKILILNLMHKELDDKYDLGSGKCRSIRDVVESIHCITKSEIKLSFGAIPYRENEPMCLVADTSRLCSLGWEPLVGFEEGLRELIFRMRKNEKPPS